MTQYTLPNGITRKHSEKCENAKRGSRCHCGCGGKLHAKNWNPAITDYNTTITEERGGEVAEAIKKLRGTIVCTCGEVVPLAPVHGYPHTGGIPDKNGERFWLYVHCNKCGYDWSWWKIRNKIEAIMKDHGEPL